MTRIRTLVLQMLILLQAGGREGSKLEEEPCMDCGFSVSYTPEAERLMNERMILKSDVLNTLAYMRKTGEAVLDGDSGLVLARHRDGNVTFWVKLEETDGGYLVHSAYSHRMNVVTR